MAALTIKDIARICNVSISTVSRAINNDPTINAKTRERVMEVVREFNYIPNNSARNLKMTESNTVALIVKGINNPFFQGMFPYFQKRLEDLGYQVDVIEFVDLDNSPKNLMLRARRTGRRSDKGRALARELAQRYGFTQTLLEQF